MDLRRSVARALRNYPSLWTTLNPPYRALVNRLNEFRLRQLVGGQLPDPIAGNRIIFDAIQSSVPHAIGKIGSLEAETLDIFLRAEVQGMSPAYPTILREQIFTNMGIFPAEGDAVTEYCRTLLHALEEIDILIVWGNPGERHVLRAGDQRTLIRLESLEPWYFEAPWSRALAGKSVVVVHPFSDTIERQYARRFNIWGNSHVLPDFELRTVRMPLSPALVSSPFQSWSEQYEYVADQMLAKPFDVALIGAGGMSLLLAAAAKKSGAVGVHMGGLTQILFGIKGRRWERSRFLANRFNEFWVRPSGAETPKASQKVEQGCYW
jgi:hypothetical protein